MGLKKLMFYVCFMVIGITLFVLGRTSALSARYLSHLKQLNASNRAPEVAIVQPERSNNSNTFSNNSESTPTQPKLLAAASSTEPLQFTCKPREVDVHNYSGGVISYCKNKNFAIAEIDSA